MKTINTQAVIEGIRARKDGSLGLTVSTPELNVQEKALFMELQNINVSLSIKPEGDNTPEYKIDKEVNQKTPSQRLRAVFFILWKQENNNTDFEVFYKTKMEQIIEHFKKKIEDY